MTLKTLKIVALHFLLSTFTLSAQTNFLEATVYKTPKDSINGLVDYQEWYRNPKIINFKPNKSQKTEALTAANVFRIIIKSKNEIFQSAIVEINMNDMRKLDNGERYSSLEEAVNDFKLTNDTILLRTLVKGAVSFYKYIDERNDEHLFIQKEQGAIAELLDYHFNIRTFDSMYTVYFKPYQMLLTNMVFDCKKMRKDFRKLSLYEVNVKKVVLQYNKCVGKEEFVKPAEKRKAEFFVFAGPVLPTAKVYDPSERLNKITGKLTGTIGLNVQTAMSYKRQPFQMGVALNLSSTNINYEKSRYFGEDTVAHKAALVGIHLSPFIRNNFFFKKSYETYGFYKLGLVLSYYAKGSYQRYRQASPTFFPPDGIFQYSNEKLAKISYFGFLSAGINVKKMSIEARYEPYGLSLLSSNYYTTGLLRLSSYSILVAYKLK